MIGWLEVLAQNPVFAGIAGGAGMSAVLYQARALPNLLWKWFERQFIVTMTLENDEALLGRFLLLLTESKYVDRARFLRMVESYCEEERNWKWLPTFGGGTHYFRFEGRFYLFHRNIEVNSSSVGIQKRDTVTVRMLGRDQAPMRSLMSRAENIHRTASTVQVHIWHMGNYLLADQKPKRSLDSVFIPAEQKHRLVNDLHRFEGAREIYRHRGTPWRRGYLLEGPPGTGKTTLAFVLAGLLDRPIYIINLATAGGDTGLQNAFNSMQSGAVAVIEDIDAAEITHQRTEIKQGPPSVEPDKAVTMAGLLNAIDGLASRENRILIVTSNYADKLDAALLRPGRIDVRETIGLIDDAELAWEMAQRFRGAEARQWFDTEIVPSLPLSPAELQARLLADD